MKSFKQYLEEVVVKSTSTKVGDHHWKSPDHHEDHDEVHTQLKGGGHPGHVMKQLGHLSKLSNYKSAMKNATTTHINHKTPDLHKISNTDAADKRGTSGNPDIEKVKHARVSDQFKKSKETGHVMTKPIMLHDTHTDHKHLIGGNTRLSHGVQDQKATVPVHTLSYDSSKQK